MVSSSTTSLQQIQQQQKNQQQLLWTVSRSSDRPLPSSSSNRSATLLNSIPQRSDIQNQRQKNSDDRDRRCDLQVKQWQQQAESVLSADGNPTNFTFGMKALLACARKRELEETCKNPENRVLQKLKEGWDVIMHCFTCAVEQGADLDKMVSVIGYLGIWYDSPSGGCPTAACGRRPGAIEEIHRKLLSHKQQQQQQQQQSRASSSSSEFPSPQMIETIKQISILDHLQCEETGRRCPNFFHGHHHHHHDNNSKTNNNNNNSQRCLEMNDDKGVYHEQLRQHFLQYFPPLQPNDDNSSFVRTSLELRQELTFARLQESPGVKFILPNDEVLNRLYEQRLQAENLNNKEVMRQQQQRKHFDVVQQKQQHHHVVNNNNTNNCTNAMTRFDEKNRAAAAAAGARTIVNVVSDDDDQSDIYSSGDAEEIANCRTRSEYSSKNNNNKNGDMMEEECSVLLAPNDEDDDDNLHTFIDPSSALGQSPPM